MYLTPDQIEALTGKVRPAEDAAGAGLTDGEGEASR